MSRPFFKRFRLRAAMVLHAGPAEEQGGADAIARGDAEEFFHPGHAVEKTLRKAAPARSQAERLGAEVELGQRDHRVKIGTRRALRNQGENHRRRVPKHDVLPVHDLVQKPAEFRRKEPAQKVHEPVPQPGVCALSQLLHFGGRVDDDELQIMRVAPGRGPVQRGFQPVQDLVVDRPVAPLPDAASLPDQMEHFVGVGKGPERFAVVGRFAVTDQRAGGANCEAVPAMDAVFFQLGRDKRDSAVFGELDQTHDAVVNAGRATTAFF